MKKYIFLSVAVFNLVNISAQLKFEKNFDFEYNFYYPSTTFKTQPMYNPLSDAYDVKFYGIDLEVDNTSIYLSGSVTIGATVAVTELDTFVFELHSDYTIDSIKVNGIAESYIRDYDDVIVLLSSALTESDWIEAQIYYHGQINTTGWSGIMHNEFYDITYTLTEPFYAKDWFPCKQVLTDKADSVYIFITTNDTLKVGSNGLLTNVVPVGQGKARYEWKTYYPTAYYLISIAIGDYVEYNIYAKPEGLEDSILIQNYIYDEDMLNYYKEDIDITADLIEVFSELFGMYPFKDEKYGHCMAPIGGGMEHQTMTTIGGFSFMLVSHELTHMWFGDYVTCGTWQDIWVNEGFATYGHLLALEQLNDQFPVDIMQQYHNDQLGGIFNGSLYIPESYFNIDFTSEEEVDALTSRIFSWGLSYEKGAIIIHMLRYELNNYDMFFDILQTYLTQHQFSTAIGTDFKSIAENVSGMDLTDFFNQWYFGEGFPRYNIQWFQENDTVYIRSVQTTSAPSTPLFKMNMDYHLVYSGDEEIVRLYQSENEQIHRVYFPETITNISVDPEHWVLEEIQSIEEEVFPLAKVSNFTETPTIDMYPNPVKDQLYIKLTGSCTSILITFYDSSGQVVQKRLVEKPLTEIDMTSFSKGIYLIEIKTGSERVLQRIIKQ